MNAVTFLTIVAAAVISISLSAGAAEGSEDKANQNPLRVKDANGKTVGRALWTSASNWEPNDWFVVMREGKQLFAVHLERAAPGTDKTKLEFRDQRVHFKTADCSGQGYVGMFYKTGALRNAAVVRLGGKTLAYVASGLEEDVRIGSTRLFDGSCNTDSDDSNLNPVTDVVDITGKYETPFSIR
jgi:hypothetical protein